MNIFRLFSRKNNKKKKEKKKPTKNQIKTKLPKPNRQNPLFMSIIIQNVYFEHVFRCYLVEMFYLMGALN